MNWLTDFVRPKIQNLVQKTELPDNLWQKCDRCEQMIFRREFAENKNVCSHCQHHHYLSARGWLDLLCDNQEYTRLPLPIVAKDPLGFRDTKKYVDRLREARQKTKQTDAVILARGEVQLQRVILAVFDFRFIGGSMGTAVGAALIRGAEKACAEKVPFVVISSSGGARMQEGVLSLMQMPRSVLAMTQVKEAGLPCITVLTHPTTGGVLASFAAIGDIVMAEPGAIIGFTGARVIKETLRQTLPEGFQSAEFQLNHGFVDMVVHRHNITKTLGTTLRLLVRKRCFSLKSLVKHSTFSSAKPSSPPF